MSFGNTFAIVFPGQGSQSVGMMSDLYQSYPSVKERFDSASDILGYDLWKMVLDDPDNRLNQTEVTQPALLTASYSIWEIWRQQSHEMPKLLAGHSLGEYTALLCADVICFDDAVSLVSERGRCMQRSMEQAPGKMAAIIGLTQQTTQELCSQASSYGIASVANFNAPNQQVVSGENNAVDEVMNLAKQAGARRVLELPVSIASHSVLMNTASDQFSEYLNRVTFRDANIPIVKNIDAKEEANAEKLRQALLKQLVQPVLWVDVVEYMLSQGVDVFIECGPGSVLKGLLSRIASSVTVQSTHNPASLASAVELLKQ